MNYFGLVTSTFASTFSRYSPQPETCITSSSSCWAQKPAPKQGCSLQGFTLSHQAGPSISPCGNGASSTAAWHPPPTEAVGTCPPACTPAGQRAPRSLRAHGGVQPQAPAQTRAARGGGGWSGTLRGVCQGPSAALAALPVQDRLGRGGEMVSCRLSHASPSFPGTCTQAGDAR